MKTIKLKNNSLNLGAFDVFGTYLKNIGIREEDIMSFENFPTPENCDNPDLLLNMTQAIETTKLCLDSKQKTFIQVDSDTDGFTSASIFINYFKARYPDNEFIYRIHDGKQHGIIVDTVPQNAALVIIPDAGSMQLEEQKELSEQGKTVIILDHHNVSEQKQFNNVYLINNQLNNFPNPCLSGAGVVFMFIKKFDETYYPNNLIYNNFIDLAALGIISDVMDSRNVGNHYIIYNGLRNIRNKMFQELLLKQSYSIKNPNLPTKIDIAFYITPIINGLIRSGTKEEKESFFAAMVDNSNDDVISSELRKQERKETIYQHAARIAVNAKARQDAAKKKMIDQIIAKIKSENLDSNKIIFVRLNTAEALKMNLNIIGLAAMDICKTYNKPTIITHYDDITDSYTGSCRSQPYGELPSFMEFLRESKLFNFVEGHDNAFGVSIPKVNCDDLITYANEKLQNMNFDDSIIEVDYYFKAGINSKILSSFAKHSDLYGNLIPEPLFAFDFQINNENLMIMGKDSSSLKIKENGVDFVMFKCADIIAQLQKDSGNYITIVGKPKLNEWMGKINTQVIIEDLEINKQTNISKLRSLI